MPNSADNTWSTRPGAPINIQWNETQACAAATAQGKIKTDSRALIHQRLRMKKPDSSNAKNIFMFTPKPAKSKVLTTVGK